MKKNLFIWTILLIILDSQNSFAQPTIDSANFTPLNHEKFIVNKCNYISPSMTISTGSNFTWDFSTFVTSSKDSIIYLAYYDSINNLNNCYGYPYFNNSNTNFLQTSSTTLGSLMYKYSVNGMIDRGGCNGYHEEYYSTLRFPFPLSYNDSTLNTYYGYGIDQNPTPNWTWNDTVVYKLKADGYGTLILPSVTYSNSMKITVIKKISKTGLYINYISYDTILYWLVPNIQHPVLEMDFPNALNVPNVFYVSQIILSSNEIIDNFVLKISPNPFSTQTTLVTNRNLKNATLTLYNSIGIQVKQIKNISGQAITLSRDDLSNGLYFIRLIEGNATLITNKLVITDN